MQINSDRGQVGIVCIKTAAKVFVPMNASPVRKLISTSFSVTALLFGTPISALSSQAPMCCTVSSDIASVPAEQRSTNSFIVAQYRQGIVPCADEERDRPVTDNKASAQLATEVVAPLVAWIVAKAGWTVHEAPPIRFIPQAELVTMFTGGKATNLNIETLYSDKDHIIYLPDGWRADDLRDRSALLHELVHHLQYLNHVKATCQAEYEWQAYELQVAWLREQGVEDPLKLMGISALAIYMLSSCPE